MYFSNYSKLNEIPFVFYLLQLQKTVKISSNLSYHILCTCRKFDWLEENCRKIDWSLCRKFAGTLKNLNLSENCLRLRGITDHFPKIYTCLVRPYRQTKIKNKRRSFSDKTRTLPRLVTRERPHTHVLPDFLCNCHSRLVALVETRGVIVVCGLLILFVRGRKREGEG